MSSIFRACGLWITLIAFTVALSGCEDAQPPAQSEAPSTATEPTAAETAPPSAEPAPTRRVSGPVRAIWVTRMDYKTPEDITRIMEDCKTAGFNHVIFQVRGNGTVFYPSKLEPWAEQFDFQDPGFDPLAHAVKEAHARGLALQAWVNVMPAWRGTKPPTHPEQLYNKRPEWFWYDQHGNRQALCDFYVSLNPCLPEVRAYLVEVFREIVANYEVDALHMDYIRFPNEHPAVPRGSGLDYPRDEKTLTLYKEATGKTPDEDKASWDQWRTDQITQLVADIRVMMREVRPAALLTAAVGAERKSSLVHFRDDVRWAEEGLIDMAFPMNYKPDLERFKAGLKEWLPRRDQVTLVPGLWFDRRQPTEANVEVVKQQIAYSVETTGNFCLFAYASMFDARAPRTEGPTTRPAATGPAGNARSRSRRGEDQRETRRAAIIPLVQSLAGEQPST